MKLLTAPLRPKDMKVILVSVFIMLSMLGIGQTLTGTWGTLSMVRYEREYNADWGIDMQTPIVSPIVKQLEGTEIKVKGYLIPLDAKKETAHVMLSAYPVSNCFFCGKAGPETAAQAFMKGGEKISYTDEKVTMKGILRINEKDMNSLLYTLEEAELIPQR